MAFVIMFTKAQAFRLPMAAPKTQDLGLPHTSAFFMHRVPLRDDASGYNFYFRRCFILDVEKLTCLWHDFVPV